MENPDQNAPSSSENTGDGALGAATPPVDQNTAKPPAKTKAPAKRKSRVKAKPSAAPKAQDKPAPKTTKPSGPRCTMEVRYQGKTYAPGENLPSDLDDNTLSELEALDAI